MPKRRAPGEGTLRQRADGRWEYRITVGYDARGRQVRRSVYGATAGEALENARKIRPTLPEDLESDRLNLATYLHQWLRYRKNPPDGEPLKPQTVYSYRVIIDRDINPRLGGMPVRRLRPLHIESFLADLANKGAADRTVRNVRTVLSSALRQAVRWRLIPESPVQPARRRIGKRSQPPASWSGVEVLAFLDEARDHRLFPLFHLALTTGARLGELLALRLEDLDLTEGVLKIERTIAYIPKEGLVFQEPKTERSRRALRLPADALEVLNEQLEKLRKERDDAKEVWTDHGLLFPSTVGTPQFPRNVVRAFESIRDRCAVRHISFHGLRHTWATLALRSGAFLPDVSARLGHFDPTFTLSTYVHSVEDAPPDALSITELTMGANKKEQTNEDPDETVN